jgi:two-component system heavy metal sensor histidine kinase CusS
VSVDLVLGEVVESLRPLADDKRVSLERRATDVSVHADSRDVERILRNLVDNAIRHSPEGGAVQIDIERGEVVRVLVRDEGEGVPADERERIFQPFHRSAHARKDARGAGLGLSIARELARRHGGDVVVGQDTNTFVVTLPPSRSAPMHTRVITVGGDP